MRLSSDTAAVQEKYSDYPEIPILLKDLECRRFKNIAEHLAVTEDLKICNKITAHIF